MKETELERREKTGKAKEKKLLLYGEVNYIFAYLMALDKDGYRQPTESLTRLPCYFQPQYGIMV